MGNSMKYVKLCIMVTNCFFLSCLSYAEEERILASDFPRMAIRISHFEERINSSDKSIRIRVLDQAGYFDLNMDKEYITFLKRMLKDPSPLVRGRAIKQFYDLWIPMSPSELPETFVGYHNDQLVNRTSSKNIEKLLDECKSNTVTSGYAAYVLGLLKVKKAMPVLRKLGSGQNIFVRYTAARALLDCGDKKEAETIFKAISSEQLELYQSGKTIEENGVEGFPLVSDTQPYYAAVACRGLIEIGGESKKLGVQRLIRLMGYLEKSKDCNDQSSIHHVRSLLSTVTGKFLETSKDADKWLEENEID